MHYFPLLDENVATCLVCDWLIFQPRSARRRLWTGALEGFAEPRGRGVVSSISTHPRQDKRASFGRERALSSSRTVAILPSFSVAGRFEIVAAPAFPGDPLCRTLGAGRESVCGIMAGRPRLPASPTTPLEMTAFVRALPAVTARPLAAADGRRCVAAGAPARAAACQRSRPHGLSMVAAGKGPARAKTDSSGRKPFVNDGYCSVPTERIRNLSIIAHIDHGTCVGRSLGGGRAVGEGCALVHAFLFCFVFDYQLACYATTFVRTAFIGSRSLLRMGWSLCRYQAPCWPALGLTLVSPLSYDCCRCGLCVGRYCYHRQVNAGRPAHPGH